MIRRPSRLSPLALIIPLALFLAAPRAEACSSAVVSGRATPDGRPLLWKHRDTKEEANDLRYFQGERFDFIGVVDTKDTSGTQVWMGGNLAGFCVMNTNAYNLPKNGYKGPMDQDGYLMKEALGRCATVDDFEAFLEEKTGKRGVIANFGVIDARGGAAFFEVSPFSHARFDATDPAVAPEGYLLRTNFSESGKEGEGSGHVRYDTLAGLFGGQGERGRITADFLLLDATRCLRHSVLATDLRAAMGEARGAGPYIPFRDYVVQHGSTSSLVVEGVRPGEDPRLTTLWTLPAWQLTSLCVPVWVAAGEPLPAVAVVSGGEPSLLARGALELKRRHFPLPGRDGGGYLVPAGLLGPGGVFEDVVRVDRQTLSTVRPALDRWRKEGFNAAEARALYAWLDSHVAEFYTRTAGPEAGATSRPPSSEENQGH